MTTEPTTPMATEPFPAAYSVLACDDLAEHVLSQFPIGEGPRCTFLSHSVNDVYRVRAEPSTYYLRVATHGSRTLGDIEAEVECSTASTRRARPWRGP